MPCINKTNQERRLEENESNIIGDNNSQGTCKKSLYCRRSQGRSCARKNQRLSFNLTSRPPSGPYLARESKGTPPSNASVGPQLNKDSSWSTRRGSGSLLKESEFSSSSLTKATEISSWYDPLLRLRLTCYNKLSSKGELKGNKLWKPRLGMMDLRDLPFSLC